MIYRGRTFTVTRGVRDISCSPSVDEPVDVEASEQDRLRNDLARFQSITGIEIAVGRKSINISRPKIDGEPADHASVLRFELVDVLAELQGSESSSALGVSAARHKHRAAEPRCQERWRSPSV